MSHGNFKCPCDCCDSKQASVTTRKFQNRHREKNFNGKKKKCGNTLFESDTEDCKKIENKDLSVLA